MSRLRRVAGLCSRTVSDTANRLLMRTDSEGSSSAAEKKSSAVPLLRSGHMSAICAMPSKEMGDSQEGRNLGVYPLVRLPRRQEPFASKAKNHRLSKDYIMIKES